MILHCEPEMAAIPISLRRDRAMGSQNFLSVFIVVEKPLAATFVISASDCLDFHLCGGCNEAEKALNENVQVTDSECGTHTPCALLWP